jgi:hypothetical protein
LRKAFRDLSSIRTNNFRAVLVIMTFKVIITRTNVEDDENAYHGIVFLNPNKVQTKRLKYVASEDILKATFIFEGNPIKGGDKFLACLVAVDGGVEIENATFKIQKNSPQNKPEVLIF